MAPAVVGGREDGKQLAACEPFEAVHDTLMRPQNKACLIILQEEFDAVGSELDDVASAVGVADKIGLDAELAVAVGGIGPQNVYDELLLGRRDLMDNLKWSLDCVYLFKYLKSATDASV